MTADMINPVVTELFIIRRKLNIFLVFITQVYFKGPKDVYEAFMKIWRLVNETTLTLDDPLQLKKKFFRMNIL